MPKTKNKKKGRNNFKHSQIRDKNNEEKEDYAEHSTKTKKEMIAYKALQNIDLPTYDIIFSNRQFGNTIIEDFTSFKTYLEEIKKQFKPELLYNNNISFENIKKEGKFCLDKYNFSIK